tara:strand:+ start:123 stop:911 length:789 start_codon:yes stop_codon:yes gene_type:complete
MNSLIRCIKYLVYIITSKTKHSIHSPYIYEFVTQVINKKSQNNKAEKEINKLRKELGEDKTLIEILDLGAGSNITKSKYRSIKDIAKNSSMKPKFAKLIYRIINFYNINNIVELGTSLAISTCYIAKANKNAKIFTLEGCPKTAKIAQKNLEKMNIKNTKVIIGDFKDTLIKTLEEVKKIDLFVIDGDHKKDSTIHYFETCLRYCNNNTILIFDDIHWSNDMQKAWKHITNHPKTRVSVDLFFLGIVFIRSELSKENFTIHF